MTDITATLKQAHVELWAFREEMADVWPTLDTYLSLQCAVCEAAEALDAWIRMTYPWMARNRDRLNGKEAVLDELADCAMMLLTAVGPGINIDEMMTGHKWLNWAPFIEHFIIDSGQLLRDYFDDNDTVLDCLMLIWNISCYPGMDLLPRLQARYARIRAKQRPNTVQDAYRRNAEKYARQLGQPYAPNATQPDDDRMVTNYDIEAERLAWGTDTL